MSAVVLRLTIHASVSKILIPWDSLSKNTGVGCHFPLQCMKVKSESHVQLFTTPWTAAYQAPPSMGFSRQEYWSGVPLPSLTVISNTHLYLIISHLHSRNIYWMLSVFQGLFLDSYRHLIFGNYHACILIKVPYKLNIWACVYSRYSCTSPTLRSCL